MAAQDDRSSGDDSNAASKRALPHLGIRPSQLPHYGDLFFRMMDSALLLDPNDFSILDANDSFEKLTGRNLTDVYGKPISEFILPSQVNEFQKMLRIVRRRYFTQTWENFWVGADGSTLDVTVNACMLRLASGGEMMQVLVRDVSNERRAEEEVKRYIKKLQAANRTLEALSTTDELTQLPNIRNFRERLAIEHSRAERYQSEYAVIFIDADHFKHYNDQNGHPAGDDLLRQLATILKRNSRVMDLPVRYGGEEFVVLCPETNAAQALVVAERIRKAVEARPFLHGNGQPLGKVTISLGVAAYPTDAKSSEEIVARADAALYSSKQHGRNRVTLAQDVAKQESRKAG